MFRLREDPHQGRRVQPLMALDQRPAWISSQLLRLTSGWSAGSSRNQRNQARPRRNRSPEDDEDHPPGHHLEQGRDQEGRQPAAQVGPGEEDALGRARSARGNHREKVLETLGKAPASPMPKRNRTASSDA